MFYETANGHGLPFDPFQAIVAPRPIGWISTVDAEGRFNLAPYSFFNAVAKRPPMVMFTSEGRKHSLANARLTGEFVCNLSTLALAGPMNQTSLDVEEGIDEFALAGLTAAPCKLVRAPRVAESPAALECRTVHVMELADVGGRPVDRYMVIGQVVAVHIDEAFLTNGRFDTVAAGALARCGYREYAAVAEVFEMQRPRFPEVAKTPA